MHALDLTHTWIGIAHLVIFMPYSYLTWVWTSRQHSPPRIEAVQYSPLLELVWTEYIHGQFSHDVAYSFSFDND